MTKLNKKNVGKAYEDVFAFNSIAGNLDNVSLESIEAQLDFITEELHETLDAYLEKDPVELLDGACDMFVTVVGFMQKLEAAGMDVAEALERVNTNNLSKFPKSALGETSAQRTAKFNSQYNVYVLKNSEGKVMKPSSFEPVDISDLAPKGFFK